MSVLEVRNLQVEIPTPYGLLRAVDGVSFSLDAGASFGLVGESGCGKSMTLRAILGLVPRPGKISSGSVKYAGQELVNEPQKALRKIRGSGISMIFQEPMASLNPVMRIGDQIAEGPRVQLGMSKTASRRRALDLMGEVGIPDTSRRFNAYPHELSGGMRQRVMIAIALACEPKVILCDEPTTALDVTIQDQILKLLAGLCQTRNMSTLFVTHDLAVVAQFCDSVAVMYAGQIVESGPVADVFLSPKHPYTLALLRAVPDIEQADRRLEPIPGRPPDMTMVPSGCRFYSRCKFATPECNLAPIPLVVSGINREVACLHSDLCSAETLLHPIGAR